MAKVDVLAKFLLSFEGGFVNNPRDRGGATNRGVTLTTWRSVGCDLDGDGDIDVDDLKKVTDEIAVKHVLKPHYWDVCKLDEVKNQAIANIVGDWAYMSGAGRAVKGLQAALGMKADGVVGPRTIAAVNALNSTAARAVFDTIKGMRADFYAGIVRNNASQAGFLKGWMRRLDAMKYDSLTCNDGRVVRW